MLDELFFAVAELGDSRRLLELFDASVELALPICTAVLRDTELAAQASCEVGSHAGMLALCWWTEPHRRVVRDWSQRPDEECYRNIRRFGFSADRYVETTARLKAERMRSSGRRRGIRFVSLEEMRDVAAGDGSMGSVHCIQNHVLSRELWDIVDRLGGELPAAMHMTFDEDEASRAVAAKLLVNRGTVSRWVAKAEELLRAEAAVTRSQ